LNERKLAHAPRRLARTFDLNGMNDDLTAGRTGDIHVEARRERSNRPAGQAPPEEKDHFLRARWADS
jgi:hypothetical protein